MEIVVKRKRIKKIYEYRFYNKNEIIFIGKVTGPYNFHMKKIFLYNANGKEICVLKQEDLKRFFLMHVPIINLFDFCNCPYAYYKDGVKIGSLNELKGVFIKGDINDDNYEICQHTGNYISIYCNNKQEGLLKRKCSATYDGELYKITINKSFNKELAVLICLLSETIWFSSNNRGGPIQYNIVYRGRKMDPNWEPEL